MSRRIAIVSDAAGYVGPDLARVLAQRGHDLVVGDPADGLVDELTAVGAAVEVVPGVRDLAKPESVERLVAPDLESGVLDQLAVRGWNDASVAAAKIVGHWLGFAPALLLACAVASGLLNLSLEQALAAGVSLLICTPGLAALGVATAALTAGLRGAGAVAGLVMLPFAVPLLIFGAGAMGNDPSAVKLLGAVSLLLVAGCPFVAGAATRMGRG